MRLHLVAVCCIMFFNALMFGQSQENHLIVAVEDATGAAIPDAWLQVQHWVIPIDGKPRIAQDGSSGTDNNGQANFEVPRNIYAVTASAPAFVTAEATVPVHKKEIRYILKLSVRTGKGLEVDHFGHALHDDDTHGPGFKGNRDFASNANQISHFRIADKPSNCPWKLGWAGSHSTASTVSTYYG